METATKKIPTTLGGVLLVAGCSIGAGMLGLPVVSAQAGLIPTAVALVICAIFMLATALLVLEATLWFEEKVSLIHLADFTLGRFGSATTRFLFLAIFFCLLVAYTSAIGPLFAACIAGLTPFQPSADACRFVALVVMGVAVIGGTRYIDYFNRLLMAGLIASYVALVAFGLPHLSLAEMQVRDWPAIQIAIPLMVISFGYHNIVPSLSHYFHKDAQKLRTILILGTLAPLLIYLFWEGVVLGLLPLSNRDALQALLQKSDIVTDLLKDVSGSPLVILFINAFALFALTTSFITNALSCVDFLADDCQKPLSLKMRIFLTALVLIPPYLFALYYPHLFLIALDYAGGFATLLLFGALPVIMVWIGRYQKNLNTPRVFPGGKIALSVIFLIALTVFGLEVQRQFF